jgi:hypothetical protein
MISAQNSASAASSARGTHRARAGRLMSDLIWSIFLGRSWNITSKCHRWRWKDVDLDVVFVGSD